MVGKWDVCATEALNDNRTESAMFNRVFSIPSTPKPAPFNMCLESPLRTPAIPDGSKVSRVDPRALGREIQSPFRSSCNDPFRFRPTIKSPLLIPPLKTIPNSEMGRMGDLFGKKLLGSALNQFPLRNAVILGTQAISDNPFHPSKTDPNSAAVLQIISEDLHKGILEPLLVRGFKIVNMYFIHSLSKFGEVVPLTQ